MKLLEFMVLNSLALLNGRTRSDYPAMYTYCAKQGNSVIDLIWVNITGMNFIDDLKVNTNVFASDHFPVCLQLTSFLQNKSQDKTQLKYDNNIALIKHLKWIWDPEKSSDYQRSIESIVLHNTRTDTNIENVNSQFISHLENAANENNLVKNNVIDLNRNFKKRVSKSPCLTVNAKTRK